MGPSTGFFMDKPKYHIVLVQPDIPGNTGQIGRSCMALGCRLHLVKPLGFQIDDKHLRRAGMDYWPRLDLQVHENVEAWMESLGETRPWLMSTRGRMEFSVEKVKPGATLVFGSETAGLPESVWERWEERSLRLPMDSAARSLNLSASVAMTLGALVFGNGNGV